MTQQLLTLNYKNVSNRDIASYPITYGVPLAEAVLNEADNLCITTGNDELRPVQAKALEHHGDGSIKWLLLDFEMPLQANETGRIALRRGPAAQTGSTLEVSDTADEIAVRTPHLAAIFNKTQFSLFGSYKINNHEMMAPGSDIIIEDLNGKRYYASLSSTLEVKLIEQGSQRVVVEASGRHTAEDDSAMLGFRVRYTFRPNEPGVLIAYKFTNLEEPETGVKLGSIEITVPTAIGHRTEKLIRQTNHGKDWFSRLLQLRENVELMAGTAMNEAAKTRYGAAAEGKVLIRNIDSLREKLGEYPYFLRPGNARSDMTGGVRQIYPYLGINGDNGSVLGWFFEMENNFPKGIRGERNVLSFDIWPAWAGDFQLRRGQAKEHEIYLSLTDTRREHSALEAIYFDHEIIGIGILGGGSPPVQLTLDPDYVRGCKVLQLHRWLPYNEHKYFAIEAKLGTLGAKGSYANKGMMDIGDYVNPDRSWAHNNENDAILDGLREYYRRAEPTVLLPAIGKARHNAHVDFIACDPDPLRQGTMPAHCPEHTDGAAYPSHMWVGGLLAAYNITGNPDFSSAALSVGENMLRWQQDNPTIFYADSRECGWPMLAFLRLYEFTREPRWLDASREVFEFYRERMSDDGEIEYELPHGVGTVLETYGEFIGWRALFFYWELTGEDEVKKFLVQCLEKVYRRRPGHMEMGWACNDLFPAWAAYALTGDDKYIEDNYPFLQFLMDRSGGFPWGGVDMHFYLAELDRRGTLARFT